MDVINRLKQHILVDGFHVVVDTEKSQDSWIIDKETSKRYLDCYSQFASQALGWNYPTLVMSQSMLSQVALHKLANSDMYSDVYADFVDAFAGVTPDFKYHFFIDGGALGVENALKAAFDWKAKSVKNPGYGQWMNVLHLKEAFHGRTGYTLSLTNSGDDESSNIKTEFFPKFNWPRVENPKITFPMDEAEVQKLEEISLKQIEWELCKGETAAIILEPIQGEGGDNHFRAEYFKRLRELADQYEAMLIFDEVQTGLGLTGKMWAYQHFGVVPDMLCFGKKTQVCGFCCTDRIDSVPNNVFHQSGRINSTWGGNIVDMARARIIINAIVNNYLVERTAQEGARFLAGLEALAVKYPEMTNVRGRGFMIAIDLPTPERRDEIITKMQENMLVLKCGSRSIRFRPHLTFGGRDVNCALDFTEKALS